MYFPISTTPISTKPLGLISNQWTTKLTAAWGQIVSGLTSLEKSMGILRVPVMFLFIYYFIYCFTAQMLKVCKTPGPTARSRIIEMVQLAKVCLKS